MIFPLDALTGSTQLMWLVSLLVGFAFGFVLERAGFGRSTKLAAQFYLRDMTVFKVMFGAIVTAGLGLVVAGGIGLVDVGAVARQAASYTFVGPMLVGGLLLGVGFIVSGYCPGTSMVASASGNIDGMVTFAGVVVGSVVFGEVYPAVADFAQSGNLGHAFLPELLGLPRGAVMGIVTAVAIGGFFGAEWVERWMARRKPAEPAPVTGPSRARRIVFAGLAGVAALGLMPLGAAEPVREHPRHAEMLGPDALAERLTSEPWSLRVVDLRARDAWVEARVPDSESVPIDDLDQLALNLVHDTRDLVLIGAQTVDHIPDAASGYGGRIFTLKGGFSQWADFALSEPAELSPSASTVERAAWAFQAALHGYLTGRQAAAPPPAPVRAVRVSTGGSGGGCN